jgi:hypothetical protein
MAFRICEHGVCGSAIVNAGNLLYVGLWYGIGQSYSTIGT